MAYPDLLCLIAIFILIIQEITILGIFFLVFDSNNKNCSHNDVFFKFYVYNIQHSAEAFVMKTFHHAVAEEEVSK